MALPTTGYSKQSVTAGAVLADFTLIVDLSDMPLNWWAMVDTSDGTKGRAAKGDETELACDWIDFDNSGKTGFLRVLWSGNLLTSANTIRIYPPVSANASVAASGTYGSDNAYDANWAAYYPCNDASGALTDRTSNGLDLTATGTPTYGQTGKIGDAISLDDGDYFSADTAAITTNPVTYMGWFNVTNYTTPHTIVSVADKDVANYWTALIANGAYSGDVIWALQQSTGYEVGVGGGYTTNTWQHAAARLVSATSRYGFLNATPGAQSTANSGALSGMDKTAVGQSADSSPFGNLLGMINDVQIHSADRSNTWITEEYNQTNDNATYWGTWAWDAGDGGAVTLQADCTANRTTYLDDRDALYKSAFIRFALPDISGGTVTAADVQLQCYGTDTGAQFSVYCTDVGSWTDASSYSTLEALSFDTATATTQTANTTGTKKFDITGSASNGITKAYGDSATHVTVRVTWTNGGAITPDAATTQVFIGEEGGSEINFYSRSNATYYPRLNISYSAAEASSGTPYYYNMMIRNN